MPKSINEEEATAAIRRIVNQSAEKAPDNRLVDANLLIESGLSKATLYRCAAMELWRAEKEEAVRAAIRRLTSERILNPSKELDDGELVKAARVDHAALRKLPADLLEEWSRLKAEQPGRALRQYDQLTPDEVIKSLVNKLYAATLVIRHQREQLEEQTQSILAQAATIERLGGNVVPLSTSGRPKA